MVTQSEILSNIDAALANCLVFDYNHTQTDITRLLNVKRATVSQYVRGHRGEKAREGFSDDVKNEIKQLASLLAVDDRFSHIDLIRYRFAILLLYINELNELKLNAIGSFQLAKK